MLRSLGAITLLLAISASGLCQHSPYTEIEQREIKALSSQQTADYRAGRGMGFALAAELNGYPGPKHVLELAEDLDLSPAQHAQMSALFDSMQSAARKLGEKIVRAEHALDAEFANETVSRKGLERAVVEIGRLNGELRSVHLAAHLETRTLLTQQQVEKYVALRGYRGRHHPQMKHLEDK
ncbi:MAG: Spy/CpxP family protein refolding chaperone [Ignavibacteria bacterium]|nr:Spy/CpxP family protein refolding chaperone [Ignavibacteria bacterium]